MRREVNASHDWETYPVILINYGALQVFSRGINEKEKSMGQQDCEKKTSFLPTVYTSRRSEDTAQPPLAAACESRNGATTSGASGASSPVNPVDEFYFHYFAIEYRT